MCATCIYRYCIYIGLDEMMGEMVAVICGVVINYVQQEETNKVLSTAQVGSFNIQIFLHYRY